MTTSPNEMAKLCKHIENLHNVKVLFAVESGSRAWGLSSKDSDYDVRFVYYRPFEEYLKLNKRKDVIDYYVKTIGKEDIDMVGFDIYKFCGLLKASNPTAIEWLMCDLQYYGKPPQELVNFAKDNFNPKALFWHYKSMCKANYLKYLKGGKEITYKKYLYAMRGLVNARYVRFFGEIPPIHFEETIKKMETFLPEPVRKQLLDIIKKKKDLKEKDITKNIVQIDNFIEKELKAREDITGIKKPQTDRELNEFIFKTLEVLK